MLHFALENYAKMAAIQLLSISQIGQTFIFLFFVSSFFSFKISWSFLFTCGASFVLARIFFS